MCVKSTIDLVPPQLACEPMIRGVDELAMSGCNWEEWRETVPRNVCQYLREYKNWKFADEKRTMDSLQTSLRKLDKQIKDITTTTTETPSATAMLENFKEERNKVLEKIKNLTLVNSSSSSENNNNSSSSENNFPMTKELHLVSNEQLAHNFLLDENCSLVLEEEGGNDDDEENTLVQIKFPKTFQRDFWNKVANDVIQAKRWDLKGTIGVIFIEIKINLIMIDQRRCVYVYVQMCVKLPFDLEF